MKNLLALLANPYVARALGALGAGLTTLAVPPHDWHAALAASVAFLGYGLAHTTATQAGTSTAPSSTTP